MKIKKNIIWKLYYLILFTTELISFEFIGNMRLYYIVSVLLLFPFIKQLVHTLTNKVLKGLTIFGVILLFTSLFSSSILGAIAGVISLALNIIAAYITFYVLYNDEISLDELLALLENLILLNLSFGLITWIMSKFGVILVLNRATSFQILNDQIAAFRTEANTHGKLVCFAVAYCIPFFIYRQMTKRKWCILVTAMLTMIISPTRSATYALIIAITIFFIILIKRREGTKLIRMVIGSLIALLIIPVIVDSGLLNASGYSMTKLNKFFLTSINEIGQDYSGSFRLESLFAAINIWKSSIKNIIVGVGYNQAKVSLQNGNVDTIASGVEIVGLLVSGGVIAVLCWLYNCTTLIRTMISITRIYKTTVYYSILSCLMYTLVMSFMSGTFYVPEIWITIGVIAYLSYKNEEKNI